MQRPTQDGTYCAHSTSDCPEPHASKPI